jgi:BirA family biotin operon repressor/biotin-[acetyl-CoA-carboxylase] ligase
MNRIKVKTAASTNDLLKELAERQILEEGTVVSAKSQTAGKGQRGNSWESEPGKNATFSLLLYPTFLTVSQQFLLSEAVALGVKSVLDTYMENIEIKWPNDIYHEGKKLSGILIENVLSGDTFAQSIVGIGVNVNQEVFLSNAPNPVSMRQILKKEINLNALLEKIIQRILYWYEKLKAGETELIIRAYHDSLRRKSGFHFYSDEAGIFSARFDRVADNGFLHLITEAGEKRCYAFKEVREINA